MNACKTNRDPSGMKTDDGWKDIGVLKGVNSSGNRFFMGEISGVPVPPRK